MRRYDTPIEVAAVLAKHAPKKMTSLLEPAVGSGVLLEPLLMRSNQFLKRVVCIDIDSNILRQVKEKFKPLLSSKLNILHADFLKWSLPETCRKSINFDCIIMNPPFSGRIEKWIRLNFADEFPTLGKGYRSIPIEVAFVVRAVRLLNPNGVLLAIVPATLISSFKTSWLRQYLMEIGAVDYVHELPKRTFKGVEARVYLFVYRKSARQRSLVVCNHDLVKPERILIKRDELSEGIRFDYSFHYARRWYQKFKTSSPNLEWVKLNEIANVYRGRIGSPLGMRKAIHTCDYRNGFWHSGNRQKQLLKDASDARIQAGDLIVKRVGRHCIQSIGKVIGHEGYACSDCLLIIRPKRKVISTVLLFTLRVLFSNNEGAQLLERGTGATYISEDDLYNLDVSIGLVKKTPKMYFNYQQAVMHKQFRYMKEIEHQIRQVYGYSL